MKRNYVGFASSAHDAAITVVDSHGQLIFAEATERYLQNKRALNISPDVPLHSTSVLRRYCEPDAEVVLAFSWSEGWAGRLRRQLESLPSDAEYFGEVAGLLGSVPAQLRRTAAAARYFTASQVVAQQAAGNTFEYELRQCRNWDVAKVERRHFDHHLTHAAAACFTSPFTDAACAIVDGYGEGQASACYTYSGGELREIVCGARETAVTNSGVAGSLGIFYMNVCEACGFSSVAGEEWKVMGLAPYGELDPAIYSLLREMIWVDGLALRTPERSRMLSLRQRLDSISRTRGQPALAAAAVAHAGQKVFDETVHELLNNLHRENPSDHLVWGGGCALNSSANGRILENTPFKQLYVISAPADDGNAVGAALLAFGQDHPGHVRRPGWQSPYLGSSMDPETIENVRRYAGGWNIETCRGRAPRKAAELLAAGKIVGWIQGRAEFGPRALGNRSILADPRSARIKDRINATVKFREEFRPFAPAILDEWGPEYFENYQQSPYMERTLRFRPGVIERVPGVVHVDGTGRLQSVRQEWNPSFHELISSFHQLTGVPVVLNTSFNVMGKPIAHSVEDAVAVFMTSGLDALFVEDLLIQK